LGAVCRRGALAVGEAGRDRRGGAWDEEVLCGEVSI
jgi:hypothetical protein